MSEQRSFWDKFWKDGQGRVVIGQRPNAPILAWVASMVLAMVVRQGWLHIAAVAIAALSLTLWAGLEVAAGVNYFRRVLGLVAIAVELAALAAMLA